MILPRTEADDLKNEIIVDITTTIIAAHLPTAILKYKLCALIYKCKSSVSQNDELRRIWTSWGNVCFLKFDNF